MGRAHRLGLSALLASAWHEGYAARRDEGDRKDAVDHALAELRGACAELGRALAYLNIDRGARGYITDPHGHRELDMVVGWLSTAYEAIDGIASDLAEKGSPQ